MQVFGATCVAQCNQAVAKLGVRLWSFKQRSCQRSQIEPGAARQDRSATSRFHFLNLAGSDPSVLTRGEILGRLGNVDQMMWHASLLGGRNLGGCDVDSAIDLNGIEIDDLTVKGERELDGEFAFARRGRPDDNRNEFRFADGHLRMLATSSALRC